MTTTCIVFGGPDHRIIVNGREWPFEDHPVCGPVPAKGKPPRAFWAAVSRWYADGKRLDASGRCLWSPAPDPTEGFVCIPGTRHWVRPEMLAKLEGEVSR